MCTDDDEEEEHECSKKKGWAVSMVGGLEIKKQKRHMGVCIEYLYIWVLLLLLLHLPI